MNKQTAQATFQSSGKRVVKLEQKAIADLVNRINADFDAACEILLACTGRIVVTGMGKSGHIANKIASTLASTGSPSFFVHPGEASHGDLGMITCNDVVLALSNSGETREVITILPLIRRMNASLIAMTGNPESSLSKAADIHLDVGVAEEACPLNLAPTSSTTTALVMGDALAIALLETKGFTAEDFAMSHPGGSLGRKLLLKIEDVMHADQEVPTVTPDTPVRDALLEMTSKQLGMTTVIDKQGSLIGLYTDGDLRRTLDQNVDISTTKIQEVMTSGGRAVQPGMLAAEALLIMEENKINGLIVVDKQNRPIGALNMHDLLRAGVM